jgi:hypothetical protein
MTIRRKVILFQAHARRRRRSGIAVRNGRVVVRVTQAEEFLASIHFPSWPGFVAAIHVFLAAGLLGRGCPAQGWA